MTWGARGRAAIGMAAVVVIVAGAAVVTALHDHGTTAAADSRPADPGYAANRAAAAREAERVLGLVSLPNGAVRQDRSPIPALDHQFAGVSPSDGDLTRTAWWTVPETPGVVAAWFRRHRPAGFRRPDGWGSSVTDDGTRVESTGWTPRHAASAYTGPELEVGWTATPGGTAVRADVFLAARAARTPEMTLPDRITDAAITRTSTPTTGGRPKTTTAKRTLTAPADTTRLAAALNRLEGVPVSDSFGTGVAMLTQRAYQVRIDWPGHTMLAAFDNGIANGATVTLTLDGRRLQPELEPDDRFIQLVDELVQEPSRTSR